MREEDRHELREGIVARKGETCREKENYGEFLESHRKYSLQVVNIDEIVFRNGVFTVMEAGKIQSFLAKGKEMGKEIGREFGEEAGRMRKSRERER